MQSQTTSGSTHKGYRAISLPDLPAHHLLILKVLRPCSAPNSASTSANLLATRSTTHSNPSSTARSALNSTPHSALNSANLSASNSTSCASRHHKKLKVSFDLETAHNSEFTPSHHVLRSHRGKGKCITRQHHSPHPNHHNHLHHLSSASRLSALLLPPSPPSDPIDDSYVMTGHTYLKDYEHSPLLTPKDEEDDDDRVNLPHVKDKSVQDLGSTTHNTPDTSPLGTSDCYSPNSEVSEDFVTERTFKSLEANPDHMALKTLLRMLEMTKRGIRRDLAQLSALLQYHTGNSDKSVAIEFFMQLMTNKLDLPKPTRVPHTPVIDWGKYHPYLSRAGQEFEDGVAHEPYSFTKSLRMFERSLN